MSTDLDELAMLLAREAEKVWRKKGMPARLDADVTSNIARQLMAGVAEGLDYDTPDADMLDALRSNTWHFSAAKNYTQLRQFSDALVGEDGRLRSYNEFKRAAFEITNQHISNWLQAEYNQAVAGAQMAGKWRQIERDSELLPLLKFDAVLDRRTTEVCRPLDGVVKPINDPFWAKWYPPNHWGCRSTVQQLSSGAVTPDYAIDYPDRDVPLMFRQNLAQTGSIFPPEHPYFVGTPQTVFDHAAKTMRNEL